MSTNMETGRKGEDIAAEYLSGMGFSLLHRNWRSGKYELDIVARKGDVLHFVEVKCRRKGSLTSPEQAATGAKFRSLSRAAEEYVSVYAINTEIQFDLVAVEYDGDEIDVRYIPEAMIPRWQ